MLILTIAALVTGADVLPEIDRPSLERQARIEAGRRGAEAARPARPARPSLLLADRRAVADLCRAAGSQRDAATFLAALQGAFDLSARDAASLRNACRSIEAGSSEARPERRNPPGFSGRPTALRPTRTSAVIGM